MCRRFMKKPCGLPLYLDRGGHRLPHRLYALYDVTSGACVTFHAWPERHTQIQGMSFEMISGLFTWRLLLLSGIIITGDPPIVGATGATCVTKTISLWLDRRQLLMK